MAIFRLEANIVSRGKKGRSVVAASAYRCGSKFHAERTGRDHDYSHKTDAVQTIILRPEGAPKWSDNPESLWNRVEKSERRKDAQLARDILLSLPRELSHEQHVKLTVAWVNDELVSKGMIVQVSFHDDGTGNPHAHLLCTLRKLDGEELSSKKSREWNEHDLVPHWRESWCNAVNTALEEAGSLERVDHRSLKARGIDQKPQPKIGPIAMAMKKRGLDPERFKFVRWVKALNAVMPWARSIEKSGEIHQHGLGAWWERSILMAANVGKTVRETVMEQWEKAMGSREPAGFEISPPEPDCEPDMDMER